MVENPNIPPAGQQENLQTNSQINGSFAGITPPPVPPQYVESLTEKLPPKTVISKVMRTIFVYIGASILTAFLVAFPMGFLAGILGSAGLYEQYWQVMDSIDAVSLLVSTVLCAVAAIAYASKRLHTDPVWEIAGKKCTGVQIVTAVCAGLALMYGFSMVQTGIESLISMLFHMNATTDIDLATTTLFGNFCNFAAVVIAAPVFEELVFRGVVCRSLSRYGKGFAIFASALLFGMVHFNFTQAVPVFGFALALGYVYLKTDSVLITIIMHMVNNFIAYTVEFLPDALLIAVEIVILAAAAAGVIIIIRQRKAIAAFCKEGNSKSGWKLLTSNAGFWVFTILFLLISIFTLFSPLLISQLELL